MFTITTMLDGTQLAIGKCVCVCVCVGAADCDLCRWGIASTLNHVFTKTVACTNMLYCNVTLMQLFLGGWYRAGPRNREEYWRRY